MFLIFFACNAIKCSFVWGLIPSLRSITRIAKSARLPPLFLRFVKAACPGVSMNKNPGILSLMPDFSIKGQEVFNFSIVYSVNEIF